MGGASAQIAYAPNATEAERHAEDLKLLRLRTIDGRSAEYKVFVTTWLGFGVHEARRRYVEALSNASETHLTKELPDPCLPRGLTVTKEGNSIASGAKEAQGKEPYIVGTGRFDECLRQTYPLLDKDAPCEKQPCLLNGAHVPAIDFDVNHFVGVSEYWHTTHEIFEMAHKDKSYDINTYQKRVEEFCSQDWHTILEGISKSKWGNKVDEATAVEVCFKASWLINVLHEGIGIPRVGLEDTKGSGHNGTKEILQHAKDKGFLDPFQAIDKIDGTEVSWTMGKMVLYAASQITPIDGALPVGFGSNAPGIPSDFQFAGPKDTPLPGDIQDDSPRDELGWHDTLLNSGSPRRIPGFLLFLLIVCIALFLLYGQDRRAKMYRRFAALFSRGPSVFKKRRHFSSKLFNGGSHVEYERIVGDGVGGGDLELGEIDSDNGLSDSSDGSGVVRSSGWATPRLKVGSFDSLAGGHSDNPGLGGGMGLSPAAAMGNAMTRRTESRERLTPGPIAGRKSRAASPTRMTPLQESYAK
ncbi:MAG: Golgi apyrase [Candelina submexicana]|nr:MAG: Golgi apyrase [Candelina submexicana]